MRCMDSKAQIPLEMRQHNLDCIRNTIASGIIVAWLQARASSVLRLGLTEPIFLVGSPSFHKVKIDVGHGNQKVKGKLDRVRD